MRAGAREDALLFVGIKPCPIAKTVPYGETRIQCINQAHLWRRDGMVRAAPSGHERSFVRMRDHEGFGDTPFVIFVKP